MSRVDRIERVWRETFDDKVASVRLLFVRGLSKRRPKLFTLSSESEETTWKFISFRVRRLF